MTPEVGGLVTQFPDHIALGKAVPLKVLGDDPVVAYKGKGLHNYLPGVAGVGKGLKIAHHAGGEDQLAYALTHGAYGLPLECHAVA